jgi:uncharacterized protein (TIGR02001 family)
LLLGSQPAAAQELSASFSAVSDYRFRGLSLSDRRAALQAGVEASAGRWFAGGWASTISGRDGSGAEIDAYAGIRGELASLRYSAAAYSYSTIRTGQPRYTEIQFLLNRPAGPADVQLDVSYAPPQRQMGNDNIYVSGSATFPLARPRLSLLMRVGVEDGFYDRKVDWEVGTALDLDAVRLSASLTGIVGRIPRSNWERDPAGLVVAATRSW